MPFQIIEISADSVIGDEQLGSKPKFWFIRNDAWWLFKERRPNTGEDWAEKIASDIARHIDVEAAEVELAVRADRIGCASRSFVKENENLLHGNEILAGQITGYDRRKKQHHCDHTLLNIVGAIQKLFVSPRIYEPVLQELAGYMVLDALICNTDRHHENWGFILRYERDPSGKAFPRSLGVAPSFDHASSLGRELLDERRLRILQESGIGRYARSGRGGIYLSTTEKRGANPIALIEFGVQHYPQYFRPALKRLESIPVGSMMGFIDQVPSERITETGRIFVKALLEYTYSVLSGLGQ